MGRKKNKNAHKSPQKTTHKQLNNRQSTMRRRERNRNEKARGDDVHAVVSWIVDGVVATEIENADVSTDVSDCPQLVSFKVSPPSASTTPASPSTTAVADFNSPTNDLVSPQLDRSNPPSSTSTTTTRSSTTAQQPAAPDLAALHQPPTPVFPRVKRSKQGTENDPSGLAEIDFQVERVTATTTQHRTHTLGVPPITKEEIVSFWNDNFKIHAREVPVAKTTEESKVIKMFTDQHTRFAEVDTSRLTMHIQTMTNREVPAVRRFKPVTALDHHYNAEVSITNTTATQTQVKFSLLNAQGLITSGGRNKSKTVSDIILDPLSQHIIAITETFLTKEVEDAEVLRHFPLYTILRGDRDREIGRKTKQGGCLLLTSPDIPSIKIAEFSNGVCEAVTTSHPSLDLTIITAYRPPDTTSNEFTQLLKFIQNSIDNSGNAHLVITGDFNFPRDIVTWIESQDGIVPVPANCRAADRKIQLQQLLDLADQHFLHQLVNLPTRSNPPNILDLIFTNTPDLFHSPETIDMTGTSDHNLVNFNTDFVVDVPELPPKPTRTGLAAFNFRRADPETLKQALTNTNLKNIVRRANEPIAGKEALINSLVEIAEEAQVPKFHDTHKVDHSPTIRKLYKTRTSVLQKLRRRGLSKAESDALKRQIKDIQLQIADTNRTEAFDNTRTILPNGWKAVSSSPPAVRSTTASQPVSGSQFFATRSQISRISNARWMNGLRQSRINQRVQAAPKSLKPTPSFIKSNIVCGDAVLILYLLTSDPNIFHL